MDDHRNKPYKEKLERERKLLFAEIKDHERPLDFGTDTEDPDEAIDKEEAFSNELAIVNDLKKRLDELDVALGKIYAGKFGACEKCGRAIATDVLDTDPATRLCKNCRTER